MSTVTVESKENAKKALDEFVLQAFKEKGYSSSSYVEAIILNTLLDGKANAYQRVNTYLVCLYRDRAKVNTVTTQVFARLGRSDEIPTEEEVS